MSISPKDFLCSAESLIDSDSAEMAVRNSLSRAYYAAYHCATTMLEELPLSTDCCDDARSGMHKRYISRLMQADPATRHRQIGVKLQALHARRIKADYGLNTNLAMRDAALQIDSAKFVFSLCAEQPALPELDLQTNTASPQVDVQGSSSPNRPALIRIR